MRFTSIHFRALRLACGVPSHRGYRKAAGQPPQSHLPSPVREIPRPLRSWTRGTPLGIKKATPDARISTELVNHMPVSATVPSPLKFLGYVPGEPGKLTYHADIVRLYEALEKASPRVKLLRIGKTDEGRDMVALVIADEATIKQLDKFPRESRRA